MVRRAVFLDRDGVINQPIVRDGKPYPPDRVEDFEIIPGVSEACRSLKAAGFLLVVVTNQPDVGRGTQTEETVRRMNDVMCAQLPIDHVEVCFAGTDNPRRKPNPGMLVDAARELEIDLKASYMVGDRWRDVDCGRAAGCTTVLIERDYDEALRSQPDLRTPNLLDAARRITALERLRVRIFADGADRETMLRLYADPLIAGLTTNPTLMRKAGIHDYEAFARDILAVVRDKPVSFEVFSDDVAPMRREALRIQAWGANVYVKIPVMNTRGEASYDLISELAGEGVNLNVTAVTTLEQVRHIAGVLSPRTPAVVSVFAGRVADTGADPMPLMRAARRTLGDLPLAELLWASVREVHNIFEADAAGCHIVTVPPDILAKAMKTVGADPADVSLDTVRMFARDAAAAGFSL